MQILHVLNNDRSVFNLGFDHFHDWLGHLFNQFVLGQLEIEEFLHFSNRFEDVANVQFEERFVVTLMPLFLPIPKHFP